MGTLSCGLIQQIQRIMALLFLRNLCKSGAVCAQVSLLCNRTEWTKPNKQIHAKNFGLLDQAFAVNVISSML